MTPLDRSTPPDRGAPVHAAFPKFSRAPLSNGIQVLTAQRNDVPLLSLQFVGTAASAYDGAQPGLASLTAALMDEGTSKRSAIEIADQIENLGGAIGAGCGWESSYLSLGLLAKDTEFAIDLLAECVHEPAFSADETERLRSRFLAELARREDQPDALAGERFAQALYAGGPYSYPQIGTSESLGRLTPADLRTFAASHRTTDDSFLLAVGDLDEDSLLARLDSVFGATEILETPPASEPRLRSISGREVHIVDRPDAKQTTLRVGHVGVSRSHADRTALVVLNSLFGGKFTSRVNLNLRERHGFTYGVSSSFQFRRYPGPFVVGTSVANDVAGAAVEQLLLELDRLVAEPPELSEVEDAKAYLLGVFPYGLQTLNGVAGRIEDLQVHGLPDDYYDTMHERLQLSPDDLWQAAQRNVHPEELAIVAVGPREELEAQLAAHGTLTEV